MRYQISAWEESATIERRIFDNEERKIFLDIVWEDAVFYADEEPSATETENDELGFLLNNLKGFEVDDYTDGHASLNFEDGKFNEIEKEEIIKEWETYGDESLTDLGYSECDSLFHIRGEIKCEIVDEDEDPDQRE